MKNRLLILGNNEFSREYYEHGVFKINRRKSVSALYYKYDIHNLSKENLDSSTACKLAMSFITKYKYSACIIALGIEDLKQNKLHLFEENLQMLLNMLKLYRIVPILLEVEDQDIDCTSVNDIIRKYKRELNLNYGVNDGLLMYNSNIQFCN